MPNPRMTPKNSIGGGASFSDDIHDDAHTAPQSFDTVIDITDFIQRRQAMRRRLIRLRIGSLILLAAALCIMGYPVALQYRSGMHQADTTSTIDDTVSSWPYPQAEEAIKAARAYNERLARSGQPVLGEAVDPFASIAGHSTSNDDSLAAQDSEYQSLLNVSDGIMGSVRIPKISVNLPIYHGTSETALASGTGHLYGSSLPVGGADTHTVLTGHRGLVEAAMFTRLDEMRVGDVFYIDVMDETLAYKVDRITVIEPDDTDALRIIPGEDRVTLMTCTPYGVNTHRLLVSGTRAEIPHEAPALEDAPTDGTATGVGVGLGVLLVGAFVTRLWRGGGWHIMRHAAWWPRGW